MLLRLATPLFLCFWFKGADALPTDRDKHVAVNMYTSYQVDSTVGRGLNTPLYSSVPIASRLWPGGRVPYRTTSNTAAIMENVLRAMAKIQERTCIRFVRADPDEADYIDITHKEGCWSQVGRTRGPQELSLSLRCLENQGVILHELLHSLGFWHEHTRSDRDEYVDVHLDNIQEDEKRNFKKLLPWENNCLNESFDYNSIMMYGSLTFSKDGIAPTMTARNGRRLMEISEKTDLSPGDIRKINKLYECNGEERPTTADVPAMECHFENDFCDFSNQAGEALTEWELSDSPDGGLHLQWREGRFTAGRVFSRYLQAYQRHQGCATFFYRFEGDAPKGLRVSRQTEMDTEDLMYESPAQITSSDGWQEVAVQVPLDGGFRLVFEGVIVAGSSGDVISVDDLIFQWKPCS